MLTLLIALVALLVIWRLIQGMVRLVLLLALASFIVFFLLQPAAAPMAMRAQTAAHEVLIRGVSASHVVVPEWQRLWTFLLRVVPRLHL